MEERQENNSRLFSPSHDDSLFEIDIIFFAASLSFYTIFAIIPLFLVGLSIFPILPGFEDSYLKIKELFFSVVIPTHQEHIAKYFEEFLQNATKIGIIGLVVIVFVLMLFFESYDYAVNRIFRTKPRKFISSLPIYWTFITLGPLALALYIYLINMTKETLQCWSCGWLDSIFIVLPYCLTWMCIFTVYLFSPNTKVGYRPALISSFVVSVVWYLSKMLFSFYVIYNKVYLSLYGSFSAVIFFLLWIYLSWTVFLTGVKGCYLLSSHLMLKQAP